MKALLKRILSVEPSIACSAESGQTQPVRTTTDSGSSTASPSSQASSRDKALVRVLHAIPEASPVDAFAGENVRFSNVAYKTVTPYKEVDADQLRLALKPAGETHSLAEDSETFARGRHYTVVALPGPQQEGEPALKVFSDNLTPPSEGKARIRVMHASPDVGKFDVYVMSNDRTLFSGVDFRMEAGYGEIAPTTTVMELRRSGEKHSVLTISEVPFESDKTYTIILTGRVKSDSGLEVITVEDELLKTYASRRVRERRCMRDRRLNDRRARASTQPEPGGTPAVE